MRANVIHLLLVLMDPVVDAGAIWKAEVWSDGALRVHNLAGEDRLVMPHILVVLFL